MATATPRVKALRSTWRKTAEHLAEQFWRFLRLTILSAVPALGSLLFSKHFDWKTLLAFIVPFAEVAFRQVWPALGASRADTAPGVTIVPSEVGLGEQDGLPPVPLPVNTDNGPRPDIDPVEQPSQDPNVVVESDPGVEEHAAPANNDEPVEPGA